MEELHPAPNPDLRQCTGQECTSPLLRAVALIAHYLATITESPEELRQAQLTDEKLHTMIGKEYCQTQMGRGFPQIANALRPTGRNGTVFNWLMGRCTACRHQVMLYFVGTPMEHIALDILGPLPCTNTGNKYLLIVADYFSKWAQALPMPNQEACTVAELLVKEVVCRFGVSLLIHSGQGCDFQSDAKDKNHSVSLAIRWDGREIKQDHLGRAGQVCGLPSKRLGWT